MAGILDPPTSGLAKTLTQLGLAWLDPTHRCPSLVLRTVFNNKRLNLFNKILSSFYFKLFFKRNYEFDFDTTIVIFYIVLQFFL